MRYIQPHYKTLHLGDEGQDVKQIAFLRLLALQQLSIALSGLHGHLDVALSVPLELRLPAARSRGIGLLPLPIKT